MFNNQNILPWHPLEMFLQIFEMYLFGRCDPKAFFIIKKKLIDAWITNPLQLKVPQTFKSNLQKHLERLEGILGKITIPNSFDYGKFGICTLIKHWNTYPFFMLNTPRSPKFVENVDVPKGSQSCSLRIGFTSWLLKKGSRPAFAKLLSPNIEWIIRSIFVKREFENWNSRIWSKDKGFINLWKQFYFYFYSLTNTLSEQRILILSNGKHIKQNWKKDEIVH
jgi:hypothetical protein